MSVTVRPIGDLLREWRQRRRLSQLELSLEAEISTRHLSFLETGRSQPSREMVLRLADQLDVPLRDRNLLLHAAGYAPVFPERPLDDPALRIARQAVDQVLAGHEPYPALAVDRHWTLIASNAATGRLIAGVDAALLRPPVNVLRLALHPAGMAPRTANLGEWRAHLLARLGHQIQVSGDPALIRLLRELRDYPAPDDAATDVDPAAFVVPFKSTTDAGMLAFFSTTTVFGTPSTSLCRNWRWRHFIRPIRNRRGVATKRELGLCHNPGWARSMRPTMVGRVTAMATCRYIVLCTAARCWSVAGGSATARAAEPGGVGPHGRGAGPGVRPGRGEHLPRHPPRGPPTAALRWQPPQPVAAWTQTLNATKFGNTCPQITELGVFAGPVSLTEDCSLPERLHAAHAAPKAKKLPVLVWIHGGGLFDGETNDYDPTALVKGGPAGPTVVVTINYRLGLLGYLGIPRLDAEGHDFGNYGLMDQRAALHWVQRNIAAFGGDPGNVTVGGQSAGSTSTAALVISPAGAGLFHRAIFESGPLLTVCRSTRRSSGAPSSPTAAGCGEEARSGRDLPARAERAEDPVAARDCRRERPLCDGLLVDGQVLPIPGDTAWTSGKFNHMPIMNGSVA